MSNLHIEYFYTEKKSQVLFLTYTAIYYVIFHVVYL